MRFRANTSTWLSKLAKKHKISTMTDPKLINRCDSCPINGVSTNIQKTLGAVAEIMVLDFPGDQWVTTAQEMERGVGCLVVDNDKLLASLALKGEHLSAEELAHARECAARLRNNTCDNYGRQAAST